MAVMGRGPGHCSDVWPVTSGDHGPNVTPGVSTHIMQTSDQCLQWGPLQTFIAVARCETGDYKETRDQDVIRVNSWEPRVEGNSRAGPLPASGQLVWRHCLTLPGIASQWSTVARAGSQRKITPILLIFCSGRKYWTFCRFVCWFAQQTKMWLGAKLICWNWIVRADKQRAPQSYHQQREEAGAGCAKHRLVSSRTGKKQGREREMITIISVFWYLNVATPRPGPITIDISCRVKQILRRAVSVKWCQPFKSVTRKFKDYQISEAYLWLLRSNLLVFCLEFNIEFMQMQGMKISESKRECYNSTAVISSW